MQVNNEILINGISCVEKDECCRSFDARSLLSKLRELAVCKSCVSGQSKLSPEWNLDALNPISFVLTFSWSFKDDAGKNLMWKNITVVFAIVHLCVQKGRLIQNDYKLCKVWIRSCKNSITLSLHIPYLHAGEIMKIEGGDKISNRIKTNLNKNCSYSEYLYIL